MSWYQDNPNPRIRFFIKDNCYYSYKYETSPSGLNYLNNAELTKHSLLLCPIGDIIIKYFNMDFNCIYNNLDVFSTFDFNVDCEKSLIEIQNQIGIVLSNFIFKNFTKTLLDLQLLPKEVYQSTIAKADKITNFKNQFDFNYILQSFSDEKDNKEEQSKATLRYMSDIRELHKLNYSNFKNKSNKYMFDLFTETDSSKIKYEIVPSMNKEDLNKPLEVFSINDLDTLILFDIFQTENNNISINICENCDKYFFPISKVTEKYCNNLYKESRRTCRELSSEIKLKNDEIGTLCRNAYKNQHARKVRYKNTPNVNINIADKIFNKWKYELNNQKLLCENGDISIETLEKWIEDNSKTSFYEKKEYVKSN